jgi:hypothetical protein
MDNATFGMTVTLAGLRATLQTLRLIGLMIVLLKKPSVLKISENVRSKKNNQVSGRNREQFDLFPRGLTRFFMCPYIVR